MRLQVFLLTIATGLAVYGLLSLAIPTVWAVCGAAWLSSAVAFFGIAFDKRKDTARRRSP